MATQTLSVYLDADGLQRVARGEQPWRSDFSLLPFPIPDYLRAEAAKKHFLGTVEVELPERDQAVTSAVATLRQQQTELRAAAEQAATQLEQRIQNLLAIEHEPFDDLPF